MIHYDNECSLYCTDNEKTVSVVVMHFRPEDGLTVVIADSKLVMKYKKTTKLYIGNLMGMEFTTSGPKYYETKKGRR